jgi:pimeloyl-ACP methyl ester carboxylesterase
MLIAISSMLAVVLILTAVLLALSPGKVKPIVGADGRAVPGSLSEKIFIDVNGARQGMFIQSRNPANPVLLYLHGGMPDYFLTETYLTGLEDLFTVAWWEQRGSGLSYSPNIPRESLNVDQMIADTTVVTNYLRSRFHQDKIYLMAHSGGTFIGIQAAAQHPELYYAYVGVQQMANQLKSETLAYDYMLAEFKRTGNSNMVKKLEAAPVTMEDGLPQAYMAMLRDQAMHMLGGGTMHKMHSVVTGIVLPSFASPQYTLTEKINTWTGKSRSGVAALFATMTTTDLANTVPELTIPVYFLEGRYDLTCLPGVAREYFSALRAPIKGFYTFENSAHSPIFEEPVKVQQIMREDVLRQTNSLADNP